MGWRLKVGGSRPQVIRYKLFVIGERSIMAEVVAKKIEGFIPIA
jgi:hypothetical protein